MSINGKKFLEVGKHIIYCLSKVSRSYVDSLVDRGDNGGVARNYVRVIAKYPDRKVDMCGIDNHEITDIPLITAGWVASTIACDVIFYHTPMFIQWKE